MIKLIENTDILKTDLQWLNGLYWDVDGHEIRVTGVNGFPLLTARLTESWISEDTWEDRESTEWYDICTDDKGRLFLRNKKYHDYKFYVQSAFNYESKCPAEYNEYEGYRSVPDTTETDDEEDEYTPSASRGDYSPSNPWDAPGMSVKDFI